MYIIACQLIEPEGLAALAETESDEVEYEYFIVELVDGMVDLSDFYGMYPTLERARRVRDLLNDEDAKLEGITQKIKEADHATSDRPGAKQRLR